MQTLHLFLTVFFILSGLLVFISNNPVHSVLFLILTFCNSSAILFLFKVDFLALTFIIIYVGAIAVLFLFVVMMLNVKVFSSLNILYTPFISLGGFILLVQIFFIVEKAFFGYSTIENRKPFLFEHTLDNFNAIDVLGQGLYNYYLVCFLLAGIVLLVAMVGAIVLTLNFSSQRKNEFAFRQLSRSDNFLSFFK
jgi:NADH:ubiquinone oxidoreductase subunit 6 (subunit J)